MDSSNLLWRERQTDSYFVESVWMCHTPEPTMRAVIADPCICISLVKNKTSTEVIIAGPKTRPSLHALPADYTCITVRLKPGVRLKNFQTSKFIDDAISIPVEDKTGFRFEGVLFKFPDFEHAEQIAEKLFTVSHLTFAQPRDVEKHPRRTYSRLIKRLTGISPYKLYQLQRLHQALRLLKHGATSADVVAELAFTDQAHFIHVSKQFLGHTPKQFKELLQNP